MIRETILALLRQYGSPVLFFGLAVEYFGLPVPGETMLSFLGFLDSKGPAAAILGSLFFAAAGTFAGSMLAWLLGYRYGEEVVLRIGKPLRLTKEKFEAAKASFGKRRTMLIILLLLLLFIFVTVRYFKNHRKVILAIAFPLLLFIKLCEDILKKELSVFDDNIYRFVTSFITKDMTDFMKFLSFLASGVVLVSITTAILISVLKNRKYVFFGWAIGVNLLAGMLINILSKVIFHRGAPGILSMVDITGFSFPSGYSFIGRSFYGYIGYILWHNWKSRWRYGAVSALSLLILLIGFSRIYL